MRCILILTMALLPAAAAAQGSSPLLTDKDRLSYAMGMDLGAQLKTKSVEVAPEVFVRGLSDALTNAKTLLTPNEAKAIITELQKTIAVRQAAEAKLAGARNRAAGDAFIASNKTKKDVVTLPSGIQYTPLVTGTGAKPTLDDTVVCHYRGTLVDGKEFDSSYTRGQPATFAVKSVIKGWTEVLQLMPVGSKWQVVIPPALGYGDRGAGADIGPDATLIFEIELVAINK
jgi:FKBP-type peptidyl-prolyl cis-trans isomerase